MKRNCAAWSTITLMVGIFLFLNSETSAEIFNNYLDDANPSYTHTLELANNGRFSINVLIDSTLSLWGGGSGITIFDSDGITLLEQFDGPMGDSDTNGSYGEFPLLAGTYYIRVAIYNTSYGNYSLSTKFTPISPLVTDDIEPNETSATATNIPLNSNHSQFFSKKVQDVV